MAAYAAVGSLLHLIAQIQRHPRPPLCLDNTHAEILIENVTFLQDFLEVYSHIHNEEADRLQSRIAAAAYAAQDVIEIYVADQILSQSSGHETSISSVGLYQVLTKVIQDVDSIKKEVMEIKEKMGSVRDIQQHRSSSTPVVGSSRSTSTWQNTMVGFDDILSQLMDKLTRRQSNRQIIPVVGMGGIGKTTLAGNVYEHPLMLLHFDIRAWATVSQGYSVKEILLQLLLCLNNKDNCKDLSKMSEEELRGTLHKSLFFRRYLIILDDVWNTEAWDKIKSLFPDNNEGSAIMITTRLSTVASHCTGNHIDHVLQMNFLDDETSWSLLCKTVFGEGGCPLQLEEFGREIAKACKGLPLSIVVIGGLLAKSEKTPKFWKYIAKNFRSIVNSQENERCLKLSYTSFNHLPIQLKPCFLYMGVFKEDSKIHADHLIVKWIAEGFVKPISGKSLEELAESYLEDLVNRNLILVHKRKHNGKIASCMIHDLLRELCLREIKKDTFFCVIRHHLPNRSLQGLRFQRRVAIHRSTSRGEDEYSEVRDASQSTLHACYSSEIRDALQSTSHTHSIICHDPEVSVPPNFKLLRIFEAYKNSDESPRREYSQQASIFQSVNLRCIIIGGAVVVRSGSIVANFLSSYRLLWNLQAIIFPAVRVTTSLDIWKMPLLRHVQVDDFEFPNPGGSDFVLENLQTLSYARNLRCSEEMVSKIPNIKKLKIRYFMNFEGSRFSLNNLDRLRNLEALSCTFYASVCREDLLQNLTFPHSLKKLTLQGSHLHWEDISTKIASLPLLQELSLKLESVIGPKWETVEGKFLHLKVLKIQDNYDYPECWTTDSSHFPCLERLVLGWLYKLKEIPSCIGDIQTLKSIGVYDCNSSLAESAKKIAKEQKELGNDDLQIRISRTTKDGRLEFSC